MCLLIIKYMLPWIFSSWYKILQYHSIQNPIKPEFNIKLLLEIFPNYINNHEIVITG